MLRDLDPVQQDLVRDVDRVLDKASVETDARQLFAQLGKERLLAVHYPIRYGGRGLTLADHSAVAERIGQRGLPDGVHLITVQEVGCTLLMYGTEQQRDRWLLDIATGKLLASILLSERGAGSDITLIETTATPDQERGWRIRGSKIWSMYTAWSGIALCSAKTRDSDSRYNSISLFMVDLSAPGVTVTPVPRLAGEPYFLVGLDNVYVGPGALIGELHRGWSLLQTSIGFERGGLDYLTQGWSWLHAIEEEFQRLPASRQTELAGDVVRLRCGLENARALAFQAAYATPGLEMDEIAAAYAKLACGQAAQAVARWAGEEFLPTLGHRPNDSADVILRTAIAEAPELTISAGALDLQLSLIAHEFPIGREVR